MDFAGSVLARASELDTRSESPSGGRPAFYKAVGISLAVASGLFIGVSFVLKKTGLLKANVKYNEEAGEGYGYLKNVWWWTGMTLMILGEVCNFVAYAFVDAILVTPLGALSVVVTTILSAIFLKERLSFVGKVGCVSCIIGSVVIAMNAPEQSSVNDIQEMQHFVVAPGFLSYAGVIIVGCTFTALWAGPRYGKRSMFVYITICSLIGGLSVVATQGLGAAILAQANGKSQFNQWFLYVLLVFVIATLLTEIIYLNKALNIFNAALVTPTYYVFFTSATIITSAVLFQGFKGSGVEIATVVMGFLQICAGVILLQLSKSAKDVPDAAVFKGDLDQVREVATQEEPESDPRADSIRGTAAIIRRISTVRRNMEDEEARRFFKEKREDNLAPPAENEIIEWDGLRRRKTVIGGGPTMSRPHTPGSIKSPYPPLGMSHFPVEDDHAAAHKDGDRSFLDGIRSRASSVLHPAHWRPVHNPAELDDRQLNPSHSVAKLQGETPFQRQPDRDRSDTTNSISWADEIHPGRAPSGENSAPSEALPHAARRQFSFNTVFNRIRPGGDSSARSRTNPPRGILRLGVPNEQKQAMKMSTEEEGLGLVHGDSQVLDNEDLNEKLERPWSSSSSELSEDNGRRLVEAQPHGLSRQPSDLTMSTTSAPIYAEHEDYEPYAENYYIAPSPRASSPSQKDGGHNSWQLPSTRSVTAHSPRERLPLTSLPSRFNPLPPLPDEDLVMSSRAETYVFQSPGHSRNGSRSISPPPAGRHGGLRTGWRRNESGSSSEVGQRSASGRSGPDEAFI
ncbi:DUF803 domain membrane protein [Aspergillus sclerotialis]|uniref:DUF803 domain membrane protein n=1 Tax=Aspergillus sclerotialis TaxID=2070753 RepID=A0A3A2ZQA5_9EURO|nr:DUF803 domain membrane protein [Aspergillus sclerotialis]